MPGTGPVGGCFRLWPRRSCMPATPWPPTGTGGLGRGLLSRTRCRNELPGVGERCLDDPVGDDVEGSGAPAISAWGAWVAAGALVVTFAWVSSEPPNVNVPLARW